MIRYNTNDIELDVQEFISFVNKVWQGDYDEDKTEGALGKTINITARDGSRLLRLAAENTPTMLYFGAQPGLEEFYEKNGCKKSLQSYIIEKER